MDLTATFFPPGSDNKFILPFSSVKFCKTFKAASFFFCINAYFFSSPPLVFVVETDDIFGSQSQITELNGFIEDLQASSPFTWRGFFEDHLIPIEIHLVDESEFISALFQHSAHENHLESIDFYNQFQGKSLLTEESIYQASNKPFILPEMREGLQEFAWQANMKIQI